MAEQTVDDILAEMNAIQDAPDRDAAAFKRARSLIGHPNNNVRWQALIAVGQWIESSPEPVWDVVLEHGGSEDEDMRMGVATVLLEHLLEHHFDTYFPLVRTRIEAGAPLLRWTLSMCGRFALDQTRWDEMCRLSGRTW